MSGQDHDKDGPWSDMILDETPQTRPASGAERTLRSPRAGDTRPDGGPRSGNVVAGKAGRGQ